MRQASHTALRSVVERLVSDGGRDAALRDAISSALKGADCAELLRSLREDPEYSFVVYEVPRDICSKPREMLSWLLSRLVEELRDERSSA